MTPQEADREAAAIKARRRGSNGQREWPRSELDRYEAEIIQLHERDLTNAEIAGWLRRQKPRVNTTATKTKAWLKRRGLGKRKDPEDTPTEPPSAQADAQDADKGTGGAVKMWKESS